MHAASFPDCFTLFYTQLIGATMTFAGALHQHSKPATVRQINLVSTSTHVLMLLLNIVFLVQSAL